MVKETYLKVGDEKFVIAAAEGIKLDKWNTIEAEDGVLNFDMIFPPLPPKTKSFDFVEGDGKNQHNDAVHPLIGFSFGEIRLSSGKGNDLVGCPHKQSSEQKPRCRHKIRRQVRRGLCALDCRLQQRPETGCDHDTGGKSKHKIQALWVGGCKKDDRSRTQSGYKPSSQCCDQRHHDKVIHITPPIPIIGSAVFPVRKVWNIFRTCHHCLFHESKFLPCAHILFLTIGNCPAIMHLSLLFFQRGRKENGKSRTFGIPSGIHPAQCRLCHWLRQRLEVSLDGRSVRRWRLCSDLCPLPAGAGSACYGYGILHGPCCTG